MILISPRTSETLLPCIILHTAGVRRQGEGQYRQHSNKVAGIVHDSSIMG